MASETDIAQFYDAARPFWHPVSRSEDLLVGQPMGAGLLGEDLVLWRTADGTPAAGDNICPHRGTRLSMGAATDDGCLQCPYHLWEFDRGGACTRIPQLPDRG